MKKIFIIYLLLTVISYGYDYPYKDPYLATVLSTPIDKTPVFKETKYKTITIKSKVKDIPKNLWYLKNFKFGLMAQDHKAPLIFLLAGTGAKFDSGQATKLAQILFQNGFSVIMLPTSFDYRYIVNISKTHAPGLVDNDAKEIYELMKVALKRVEKKIDYDDTFITGYSLGGSTALLIGDIDSRENYFNFKRILAINPSVNLYESAILLDDLLDKNIKSDQELDDFLNNILMGLIKYTQNKGSLNFDKSEIFSLFKKMGMKDTDLKILIGLAFRLKAIDINYISDIMTKSNIYTDSTIPPTKFQHMSDYYSNINYSNFKNYIHRIGYKTYHKSDNTITLKELVRRSSIKTIDSFLRTSDKIAVITNANEIILTKENITYLKNTLGDRLKIYPYGGHCGNMFYTDNVEFMVDFLLGGKK